jgi:hypothetical protein
VIIGIDVDGTLAIDAPFVAPDVIARPDQRMVRIVQSLYAAGHILCIWTCRADYIVKAWLKEHGLDYYFSHINCSPLITDSIKPNFDLLIDNAVVRWMGQDLSAMKHLLRDGQFDIPRDPNFSDRPPVPYLAGTGKAYLDMFDEHWENAWKQHKFSSARRIAFLTICSHAKPYSKSYIHSTIRQKLHEAGYLQQLDYIHVSNAGIIPSEAEMVYPFNAYDHDGADMTAEVSSYFEEKTTARMQQWFANYGEHYDTFVVYLRYGKTYRAVTSAITPTRLYACMANVRDGIQLPFAALNDPDDVLTNADNLRGLIETFKGASIVAR